MTRFEKNEEVLAILYQSIGNILMGAPTKDTKESLLATLVMYQFEALLKQVLQMDYVCAIIFPSTPRMTKSLRCVLRDVISQLI
jgi:hypothetical protein